MGSAVEYRQAQMWAQPTGRWVAHVDMDAFFASIEQHDDPSIMGRPVIVGNSPMPMEKLREMALEWSKLPRASSFIKGIRGVVASASYEARAFGVRSAMPLAQALALSPDAVVVPGRFGRYREVSAHLRRVWGEFSPLVEPMSLDEAYIDLTGSELSEGPVRATGARLKHRIKEETGLTASVGIGSSKLVSKIASDLDKPDGLVVVAHGNEAATLAPLPVRAIPGIGPRTGEALQRLGITQVGQLAVAPFDSLAAIFGADHAAGLQHRAMGIDDSPVQIPGGPKSISRETTLAEDSSDISILRSMLRVLAGQVGWSLRQEGFTARCIYIKLRLLPVEPQRRSESAGFGTLITRRCTLPTPTDADQAIYKAATTLLDKTASTTGLGSGRDVVRLLGVGTAMLVHTESLLIKVADPSDVAANKSTPPLAAADRDRRLNASLDAIRARYGFDTISVASTAKGSDG